MLAAILLLASIALIVAKAAGLLAISWLVALIPAIVLLVLGFIGAVIFVVVAAVGSSQVKKAEKEFTDRNARSQARLF